MKHTKKQQGVTTEARRARRSLQEDYKVAAGTNLNHNGTTKTTKNQRSSRRSVVVHFLISITFLAVF